MRRLTHSLALVAAFALAACPSPTPTANAGVGDGNDAGTAEPDGGSASDDAGVAGDGNDAGTAEPTDGGSATPADAGDQSNLPWGAACTADEECGGSGVPGDDTFCTDSTGGYCLQVDGPDYNGDGVPCTGDSFSVGASAPDGRTFCFQGCDSHDDCRPGYLCKTLDSGSMACLAVTDCVTNGCNDVGEPTPYYCDPEPLEDEPACWIDGCAGNPCENASYSTGTCYHFGDEARCECVEGSAWDEAGKACSPWDCPALDFGTLTDTALTFMEQNSCDGTSIFNPGGGGCTGWSAPGHERIYTLTLPARTGASITAGGADFDLSLYVLESCSDFVANTCLDGSDFSGDETVDIVNDGDSDKTYYAIVDAAWTEGNCGDFGITVSPYSFECDATDLGTFDGSPITLEGQSNCEGSDVYDPGPDGCTDFYAAGKEVLYSLTIPANQSVTVRMSPTAGGDVVLYAIDTCGDYGATSCVDGMGDDTGGMGQNETITLSAGDTDRAVTLVADSWAGLAGCAGFNLTVEAAQ